MRERLKAARTRHERAVRDRVGHRARAVAHGLEDLRDDVLVRTLDEDRAREGVLDALEEGVHFLAKRHLLDLLRVPEALGRKGLEGVDLLAAAREANALHV